MRKISRRRRTALRLETRRRQVAELYVNEGFSQEQIATRVGVSQQTVSRDIAALMVEWRNENSARIDRLKGRENAELRQIEAQAAEQFRTQRSADFLRVRIRVKERRARMFGLDKPLEVSGPGGMPLPNAVPAVVNVYLPDNGRGDDQQ